MGNRIFGYEWEDIQRAQRGGRLINSAVDTSHPPQINPEQLATARKLLAEHGADWLVANAMHGVIDALRRAGDIT